MSSTIIFGGLRSFNLVDPDAQKVSERGEVVIGGE